MKTKPENSRTASGARILSSLMLCGLALTGCSMISGQRRANGDIVVTSWRFLWKSEAIAFTTTSGDFTVALGIGKSRSDEESIALATEAAVKAAAKSFVPLP